MTVFDFEKFKNQFNLTIICFNKREKEHEEWLDRDREQVDEIRSKQAEEDGKRREQEDVEVSFFSVEQKILFQFKGIVYFIEQNLKEV